MPGVYICLMKFKLQTLKPKAMKATTIISALSLALILSAANAGFAKSDNGNPNVNPTIRVKYQVALHMSFTKTWFNHYLIEMTDANGRLVAAPKPLIPGVLVYNFEEITRQTDAVRVARLVLDASTYPPIINMELRAKPDAKLLHLQDGAIYNFDLYPQVNQIKDSQ